MNRNYLVIALLALANIAVGQARNVDHFIQGDDSVSVFFYDPLAHLIKNDKSFQAKSDKEKSEALNKHLHQNPVFLFHLTNVTSGDIRYLCIRGNPEKQDTKMFYKVEYIRNVPADFNPFGDDYSDKIVTVIHRVDCGGTLFENMSLFDDEENKKVIGNGIQLFGYYRRVQPYSEIKASIAEIITELAGK